MATENIELSKYNFQKLKVLTSLGAIELLLLLRQVNFLTLSVICEKMDSMNLDYISKSTIKNSLKLLLQYRLVLRCKKGPGKRKSSGKKLVYYSITETGKEVLRWLEESPIYFLNKILLCAKCLSIYEISKNRQKCGNCKGADLLLGTTFNGIFIESDGSLFISLADLEKLPVEDVLSQRLKIRLFILDLIYFNKEMGIEQIPIPKIHEALEVVHGKYQFSFVRNVMNDMAKKGEIYFPNSTTIATKMKLN